MAASKKGAFTIGLLMAISFGAVLFLMFSEIFPVRPARRRTGWIGRMTSLINWPKGLLISSLS